MPIPNKSVISPGQALLLLINRYQSDTAMANRLKKLYLTGAENAEEAEEIFEYLKDPYLSKYDISSSPETINNDPVRRYFETHLAYETLKRELAALDYSELSEHYAELQKMLPHESLSRVC